MYIHILRVQISNTYKNLWSSNFTEPKVLQCRTPGLHLSMQSFYKQKQIIKKSLQKIHNKGILKIINIVCLQIVHFGRLYRPHVSPLPLHFLLIR